MYAGIDLGQRRLHIVVLNADLSLRESLVMDVSDLEGLPLVVSGCEVIAIDAPEALSTTPHAGDDMLSPKFRLARCAEIALGLEHKVWVPWVTPASEELCQPWMLLGFQVFDLVRRDGRRVVEVYPHGAFRRLAGGGVPSKSTAAGLFARAQLLRHAGLGVDGLEMWSHDSLDAAVAAIVARHVGGGSAQAVGCGHDDSVIWLPRPLG